MAKSLGHLFVNHGDLSKIAADDVLVACDADLQVTTAFKEMLGIHSSPSGVCFKPVSLKPPAGMAKVDRESSLIDGTERQRRPGA